MLESSPKRRNTKIIEEKSFRSKRHVFEDRYHAGKLLADKLKEHKEKNVIVLAIPSGGVPVGYAVSERLGAPLDLAVVRKITIPWNPEAGFGAVTPDGTVVLNQLLVERLGLRKEEIEKCTSQTLRDLKRRLLKFRGDKPFPDLKGKTAIIVDDGLASGYTMLAAILSTKKYEPKRLIVAVPTAPPSSIERISPYVDEIVCLNIRAELFFAVADAYITWYDLEEEEVMEYLDKAQKLRHARKFSDA